MPHPNKTTGDILLIDLQNRHVENLVDDTEEEEVPDEFVEVTMTLMMRAQMYLTMTLIIENLCF